MAIEAALNWLSVLAALFAAAFWFASAAVRLPGKITVGYGGSGGSVQELGDAVRRQSRLSALGAVSAGIAALCQAVALAL